MYFKLKKKSSNRPLCNWFRVRAYKKERGICFVMQKTPILWHLSTMENWIKVPKGIYFFFFKATSFKSCTMGGKRNFPWKDCIIGLKFVLNPINFLKIKTFDSPSQNWFFVNYGKLDQSSKRNFTFFKAFISFKVALRGKIVTSGCWAWSRVVAWYRDYDQRAGYC